ncbi:MAG: 2-C-methyl-D-erythritol 4-phosphate cytidylyltransferase [Flavobacteriales bacterium]|nr:2-C-methyl-D-erythritol 4-phosphate cytidylyltransferase [Flavobacteriales bacterium]
MKDFVIIVAAGSGSRMKTAIPKQFLELSGKPILQHTIEKFHRFNPNMSIIVVLNDEYITFWRDLMRTLKMDIPHEIIPGGAQRFYSVKNAIQSIQESEGIVGIHDAVRPLVSLKTIENCYSAARIKLTAVPVISLNDSIRIVQGTQSEMADRSKFRIVQTPQCFELSLLKKAFDQPYEEAFTDDASVVERYGYPVHLVEGNRENLKVTTAEDLRMAEALLL